MRNWWFCGCYVGEGRVKKYSITVCSTGWVTVSLKDMNFTVVDLSHTMMYSVCFLEGCVVKYGTKFPRILIKELKKTILLG